MNYCPFPYTSAGWGDDGVPGNSDVTLGDCSLNIADAFASSSTMQIIAYGGLTFLILLCALYNSHTKRQKRLEGKKKDVITVSEKLAHMMTLVR